MLEKGIVEEFIAFKGLFGPSANLLDGSLLLPIGYKQLHDFVKELRSQLQAHQVSVYSQKGGSLGLNRRNFCKKFQKLL